MPIHLLPDDEVAEVPSVGTARAEESWVLEVLPGVVRPVVLCLAIGCVLLPVSLWALKAALVAADVLLRDKHHWQEAWMPALLLAFFGGLFGAVLGWRMVSASGTAGWPVALAGGVAIVCLAGVGAVAAFMLFSKGVPMMGWIGLGAMAASAMLTLRLSMAWLS